MTKAEPVSSGQSLNLHPLNDCCLVELQQSTKNFNVKEGRFDSRTEGILVEVPGITLSDLIGKSIHFDQFNASEPIKRNGKQYGFVKIADIRGWEE